MKRASKKDPSKTMESQALPEWQEELLSRWSEVLEKELKDRPAVLFYWDRGKAEEWISNRCKACFGLLLAFDLKGTQLGGRSVFHVGEEELRKLFDQAVLEAVNFFGDRIGEMAKTIWSQALTETDQMMTSIILKMRLTEQESKPFLPIRSRWEEHNLSLYRDGLSRHKMRDGRGGKSPKAYLGQLSQHYDKIIEDWKEAFIMYGSALSSNSPIRRAQWRDDIKKAFPDFPDDLIERLQPKADWSDSMMETHSIKGGDAKSEDIALEHAARLCGAEPYAYGLASLRKKLSETRRVKPRRISKSKI